MRNFSKEVKIDESAFVTKNATVLGDVTIGKDVSIWFSAVLRGDINSIVIEDGSNVQDNATVHVDKEYGVKIGKNVSVGHNAIIHGCTIEDDVLIGMGAIILNGAHIGKNTIIGAGALVTEGKTIPEGSLVVGSPAKVIREISPEQLEGLKENARNYVHEGKEFKESGY